METICDVTMSMKTVKLPPKNVESLKLQSCQVSCHLENSSRLCDPSGRKNTYFWPSWFYIQIVVVEYCFIPLTSYTDVFAETAAVRHKGVWHSICHKNGEVFWKISLKIKKEKPIIIFQIAETFGTNIEPRYTTTSSIRPLLFVLTNSVYICIEEKPVKSATALKLSTGTFWNPNVCIS